MPMTLIFKQTFGKYPITPISTTLWNIEVRTRLVRQPISYIYQNTVIATCDIVTIRMKWARPLLTPLSFSWPFGI